MQEVAIVQCLQTEIAELQIAFRHQCITQFLQVELRQLWIEQICFDAVLDEFREVINIVCVRICLRNFLAEHFLADRVHQQTCGNLAVRRIFFH